MAGVAILSDANDRPNYYTPSWLPWSETARNGVISCMCSEYGISCWVRETCAGIIMFYGPAQTTCTFFYMHQQR